MDGRAGHSTCKSKHISIARANESQSIVPLFLRNETEPKVKSNLYFHYQSESAGLRNTALSHENDLDIVTQCSFSITGKELYLIRTYLTHYISKTHSRSNFACLAIISKITSSLNTSPQIRNSEQKWPHLQWPHELSRRRAQLCRCMYERSQSYATNFAFAMGWQVLIRFAASLLSHKDTILVHCVR